MRWSKIKKRFEDLVAPSLHGRVQVHVTNYRETKGMDVGRGWITVDGEIAASVQMPSFYTNYPVFAPGSTMDFDRAVAAYIDMPIRAARSSPDVILRGLTFLDKRLGKRSLAKVDQEQLHDFEKILFTVRCRAEGLA
jgi:hypothetical protein